MFMVLSKRMTTTNNYTIQCSCGHVFDCSVGVSDVLFLGVSTYAKYVYDGNGFNKWDER